MPGSDIDPMFLPLSLDRLARLKLQLASVYAGSPGRAEHFGS